MRPVRPEHRLLGLALPLPGEDAGREMASLGSGPLDWSLVVDLAERLGALPLLGAALERSAIAAPDAVRAACQEALTRGMMRVMVATRIMGELRDALEGRSIRFLVLKGLPLACEIYPHPGLRPIGDLDILVPRGVRDAALEVLLDLGYHPPSRALPIAFFRRHHFHLALLREGLEGLPVELHWDTQPFFSFSRIPEADFWSRQRTITVQGLDLPVPGREESFLYLAQHLMRHVLSFGPATWEDPVGAFLEPARRGRLTWIADLALLARSGPGLDWERVGMLCRRWGLDEEIAGLRAYLTRAGVWPGPLPVRVRGTEMADRGAGIVSRAGALLPGLSRPTAALQMRPILVFRLFRFAWPGTEWIRWRYGMSEGAGRWRVGWQTLRHAAGTTIRAARMAAAIVTFKVRPRRTTPIHASGRGRAGGPPPGGYRRHRQGTLRWNSRDAGARE